MHSAADEMRDECEGESRGQKPKESIGPPMKTYWFAGCIITIGASDQCLTVLSLY